MGRLSKFPTGTILPKRLGLQPHPCIDQWRNPLENLHASCASHSERSVTFSAATFITATFLQFVALVGMFGATLRHQVIGKEMKSKVHRGDMFIRGRERYRTRARGQLSHSAVSESVKGKGSPLFSTFVHAQVHSRIRRHYFQPISTASSPKNPTLFV